jgi:hypothetical protein
MCYLVRRTWPEIVALSTQLLRYLPDGLRCEANNGSRGKAGPLHSYILRGRSEVTDNPVSLEPRVNSWKALCFPNGNEKPPVRDAEYKSTWNGSEFSVDTSAQGRFSRLMQTHSHREFRRRMRGTLRRTDAPAAALDLEVQTCACPIGLRFPSVLRIPSMFRIGAVNIVVTKAMMTIMVKSVGVKAPTL